MFAEKCVTASNWMTKHLHVDQCASLCVYLYIQHKMDVRVLQAYVNNVFHLALQPGTVVTCPKHFKFVYIRIDRYLQQGFH